MEVTLFLMYHISAFPVLRFRLSFFLIHFLKKNILDTLIRNVPQIRPIIVDIRNTNGTSELKLKPTLKAGINNPKTKCRPIHN